MFENVRFLYQFIFKLIIPSSLHQFEVSTHKFLKSMTLILKTIVNKGQNGTSG